MFHYFQCETMGLQPTSPPTSPLHRMPPAYHHAGLKRKHDNLEEDDLIPPNNIEYHTIPKIQKRFVSRLFVVTSLRTKLYQHLKTILAT